MQGAVIKITALTTLVRVFKRATCYNLWQIIQRTYIDILLYLGHVILNKAVLKSVAVKQEYKRGKKRRDEAAFLGAC